MSLTKKVYLTISGYDIKLSDNLTFYQKDQLKLIFYINEYGIDYENNATTRALMPVNPLNAILFIENPDGVDSVSSAKIEDNAVTFYLDSTHTQYVGVSRMQLRLFDQDGCAITLPHFTFEIRENIYGSGDVRFQNVVMVDQTGTVILTEDNDMLDVGDILTMGTEVAYPQVAKTIKELPIKHGLDGTEKLIVEDDEATKQAPLGTIVDEIKQNSQEKIREIESELAQTNAQLSNIETHLSGYVNILSFGAIRNDKSYMNDAVFSEAITYCSENKVGLFIPQGNYYISDPIFLKRDVNIIGNKATIKMVSNNTAEYVMYAQNINNFKISGINLCGNRTNFSEGNTVSTDGLFLKGCSYFTIEEMNYSDCKNGFRAYMSYCGEIKRCTSIRCQKYAFNCSNSCTSLKFDTCISWGCGGGFNIISCVYMTIINPANDHNSAGGSDNDPWLPQGSGGNYLNPLPIYKIVGSQVSIISSGTENAFSPLIHMEGASVVMTNPYFWKSQCYADDFRFIKIVGTGVSSLDIINADFRDIENKRDVYYTRCGIYVDNSDKQKIRTNKYFKISDTFGVYDMYNIDAMVVYDREIMLNFNKYTANINSLIPFLSQNGAYGEVKLLDNNYVFECPKQAGEYIYKLKKGVIKLKISGTYQSPTEKLDMKVIGCNGEAETVVDSFSNDGNNVTFRKIINLSGYDDCYLKLTYVYNSSSFKINEFVCEVLN